jgi:hypothetical protein
MEIEYECINCHTVKSSHSFCVCKIIAEEEQAKFYRDMASAMGFDDEPFSFFLFLNSN